LRTLPDPVLAELQEVSPTRAGGMDSGGSPAVRFQLQLHKILWGDVPGKMNRAAVVLLSGGLDSGHGAGHGAVARGFECYALSVHYGQRHSAELAAARASPRRWARANIASWASISPASAARR
jgi:hypothetical protein